MELSLSCMESPDQLMGFLRKYLEECGHSSNTITSYVHFCGKFVSSKWDKLKCCSSVTDVRQSLQEYFASTNMNVPSKRLTLASVRKLMEMLGMDGTSIKFRFQKVVKQGVKHLTEAQFCAIIEAAGDHGDDFHSARDCAILSLFGYLGLRLTELSNLSMSDIDIESRSITVLGKGNKLGHVPIVRIVFPHLEKWLRIRSCYPTSSDVWITKNGDKLSKRAIQYMVSSYVKQFDRKLSTHSLRHTAATTLINNGVELKTVSALLRHANLNVTADIYAHKSVESVGNDMDKVYGG